VPAVYLAIDRLKLPQCAASSSTFIFNYIQLNRFNVSILNFFLFVRHAVNKREKFDIKVASLDDCEKYSIIITKVLRTNRF